MTTAIWIPLALLALAIVPLLIRAHLQIRHAARSQAQHWRSLAESARAGGRIVEATRYERTAQVYERRTRHWWSS
jgi:hypothetical protein